MHRDISTNRMITENYITKGEAMSVIELFIPSPSRLGQISLGQRFSLMGALRKERAELANLTDQQLMDIGVTPDQARNEAAKPAWDMPEDWSRRL